MIRNFAIDARMIDSSGIGKVIENITKRFILGHSECKFYLLGNRSRLETFSEFRKNNVNLIDCNTPIYSVKEQIDLPRYIPSGMDIFWAPHYNMPIRYNGRVMITIHDVFHLAMPQYFSGIHKKIYAKIMFNQAVKKADKIICVSRFTQEELIKFTGVNSKKIEVIYNGVDDNWFHIEKKKSIHKKPYLLFVGNIKPHKNLRRLLSAYETLMDKIPHDLVLVGQKKGFITGDDEVAHIAERLGSRVVFTGYVEEAILYQYYKQASGIIFPSLYEGFGLVPIEGMATMCPVLVADIMAIREVCKEFALYCDPYIVSDIAKGILKLVGEYPISLSAANEWAKSYNWDKSANQYWNACTLITK